MYDELSNQLYAQPVPGQVQGGVQGMPEPQFDMSNQYAAATPTDEEYAREAEAAQAMAGPAADAPSLAPTQVGQKSGGTVADSISTGQSGTNFGTLDRLDKRAAGPKGIDGKLARSLQGHEADATAYKQSSEEQSNLRERSLIETTDIKIKADEAEADAAMSLGKIRLESAEREKQIMAKSELDHQSYMADYKALNQEIRATTMNPGKLFADMTGGDKAGMLVTAFVHDYLGTKGVKTSSMDTYNKAIERSIDAQVANLGTKKAALSGMQQMWDMQRAQSKTDEEARVRIHGLTLQSLGDELKAKLSMFDSEHARASLPAGLADIEKAQMDNDIKLDGMVRERYNQDANILLTQERDRVNAARSAAEVAVSRRRVALEEKKYSDEKLAADAVKPGGPLTKDVLETLIVDPSKGQVFGKNRMWLSRDPKVVKELQTKVSNGSRVMEMANEYAALANKVGKTYQGPLNKYTQDADVKKMFQLNDQLTLAVTTGWAASTFTDKLVEKAQSLIPKNGYLTAEAASQMAGQFALNAKQDIEAQLTGFTSEAGDDIKKAYRPSARDESEVAGLSGKETTPPDGTYGAEGAVVARDWQSNLKPKQFKADVLAGEINDDNKFEVAADYQPKIERLFEIARSNGEEDDQRTRAREILNNYAYDPKIVALDKVDPSGNYSKNNLSRNHEISGIAKYYLKELAAGDDMAETQRQGPQVKAMADEFGHNLDKGRGRSTGYVADSATSLYGE